MASYPVGPPPGFSAEDARPPGPPVDSPESPAEMPPTPSFGGNDRASAEQGTKSGSAESSLTREMRTPTFPERYIRGPTRWPSV